MNDTRALQHLMDVLAVEGLSGQEGDIAKVITKKLKQAGCKASWFSSDRAHEKIPLDFERGNLIVQLPGTLKGERLMFSGHMDTVPICRGAEPVIKGKRIVSKKNTGLGGDNRVSVAALINLAETLLREKLPHPPITLLFTVGEEVGLWGARMVKKRDLGHPKLGFNIDSGNPAELIIGAVGAHRWDVEIYGKSAHAGVHPDQGISATLIAARAIADADARGYFGKIRIKGKKGTSNIGAMEGGEATNQVSDFVTLKGESRSHDPAFLEEITMAWEKAFQRAAAKVKNHKKQCGRIVFKADRDYDAFKLDASTPCVKVAKKALKALDMKARTKVIDGGLDANYLNVRGIPTVTLGAGQHHIHTTDEYIDIPEFLTGCSLSLEIVNQCVIGF